jgi:isopentenyl-diphosphate delta-isomerase
MSDSQTRNTVLVVDERDRPIGVCDKILAHRRPGMRHRAFSVFLFTPQGELLLQRRADTKYHFAGKWSNSCDGHPDPYSDDLVASAAERVMAELGVPVTLTHVGVFNYQATDEVSGLVEDEVDHVLVGELAADPRLNAAEVSDVAYWRPRDLSERLAGAPDEFVPWLSPALATLEAAGAGVVPGRR